MFNIDMKYYPPQAPSVEQVVAHFTNKPIRELPNASDAMVAYDNEPCNSLPFVPLARAARKSRCFCKRFAAMSSDIVT